MEAVGVCSVSFGGSPPELSIKELATEVQVACSSCRSVRLCFFGRMHTQTAILTGAEKTSNKTEHAVVCRNVGGRGCVEGCAAADGSNDIVAMPSRAISLSNRSLRSTNKSFQRRRNFVQKLTTATEDDLKFSRSWTE